jgi:hypothetical protein
MGWSKNKVSTTATTTKVIKLFSSSTKRTTCHVQLKKAFVQSGNGKDFNLPGIFFLD